MSATTFDMCLKKMTKKQIKNSSESLFSINVETLRKGSITIDRDLPMDWLAQEMNICGFPVVPIRSRLSLNLELLDQSVLVQGFAEAMIEVKCSLCLSNINLTLKGDISNYLSPMPISGTDELLNKEELTPEDLEKEYYSEDTIVLDNLIRDAIMLELPMTPRCENSCSGIIKHPKKSTYNAKQSVDPRLAPLADIKLSKEN